MSFTGKIITELLGVQVLASGSPKQRLPRSDNSLKLPLLINDLYKDTYFWKHREGCAIRIRKNRNRRVAMDLR